MSWKRLAEFSVMALLATACGDQTTVAEDLGEQPTVAEDGGVPTFAVDPSWPTIPNGWVLGQVSSVTVDGRDHVWVLHRPRTVEDEQQDNAAPPVLEFDDAGTFIRAWGGPGADYEWPANEHGIHVDYQGHVWIGGNGGQPESDDMLLKFTTEGELLLQIGRRGQSLTTTKRLVVGMRHHQQQPAGRRQLVQFDRGPAFRSAKHAALRDDRNAHRSSARNPPPARARAAR
mgnify:CR=1 FL=1